MTPRAEEEAGKSPFYGALARSIAQDEAVLALLLTLPGDKQQPNLLLVAFRNLFGTPGGLRQPRDAPTAVARIDPRSGT